MAASNPNISIHNLSFHISDTAVRFDSINLSFSQRKIGVIGDNGIGKTSLFKLITGELAPTSGTIHCNASICYCPQIIKTNYANIATALGVKPILDALQRIKSGSTNEDDYAMLNEQWDIEEKVKKTLDYFYFKTDSLCDDFNTLSGGEKTKLQLARAYLSQADFILLDEPTNNLDQATRLRLQQFINSSKKHFIVISHDRDLLNQMNEIVELSTLGINHYGGNYNYYFSEKQKSIQAAVQLLNARKEETKKAKQLAQIRRERHEQAAAKGRKAKIAEIRAKGSYDKLGFKSAQGRSEATNKRIKEQAKRKINGTEEQLSLAKTRLEFKTSIDVSLDATQVPKGKTVLNIENLTFYYDTKKPLFRNFNLHLQGPERVALTGKNGCGKTTLIKLIRQQLPPIAGRINLGVKHICYLDQQISFLDKEKSLLDNFIEKNPKATLEDAHLALAQFNFRNQSALKQVKHLSGGERIRAGLAISMMSDTAPQLIILDEPSNHLDIRSIEQIEMSLANYQGALIVISHDQSFLSRLSVNRYIQLEKG